MCTVKIDATGGVARVIFDESSYLGIERSGASIGEVISFENGENEIIIYNGEKAGAITFLISFSNAYGVITNGAVLLATVAAILA